LLEGLAVKDGNYLDGGKSYKPSIPANVPAQDFWSIVVYDPKRIPIADRPCVWRKIRMWPRVRVS